MPRVLIIQAVMKQYRVPFFTKLHAALLKDGIELTVAYSPQNSREALRQDDDELPLEFGHKVDAYWFADRFLYQSVLLEISRADLVIVNPENKYILNPFLLLLSALRLKTVAFWGLGPMHPYRFRSSLSEWIRKKQIGMVDWWFAYTETVAEYLCQHDMPAARITNVQNATDTAELRRLLADFQEGEITRAKFELTGSETSKIGFYCGLLGEIKAIPLLIDAARLVRERCPEFHLVIVGNGPGRPWLEKAIAKDPWIHYLGSKFGRESALLYKMADLFLMAGTAGLAVVDSFAAGLPLIATQLPIHPPEVSYLRDGENGRMTAHTAHAFADGIVEVLTTPPLLEKLRHAAEAAGAKYTIEAMVENYRTGINQCLASTNYTSRIPLKLPRYGETNVDA
jgi:glycosyltransferase involved in cell wall biosynthesis